MKRLPIGIFILIVLIILGIWTGQRTGVVHGSIVEDLEAAAAAKNWAQTVPAETARQTWENHRGFSAAITDHSALDEIEAGFAQLEVYRQRDDLTDFTATCARLSKLITAIREGHKLNWENVL